MELPQIPNDAIRRGLATLGAFQIARVVEGVLTWLLGRMGHGSLMCLILSTMVGLAVYVKLHQRIVRPWD